MVKKTPTDNIFSNISRALDCIVAISSQSTGKTNADSELDFLKELEGDVDRWRKVPESAFKLIGETLFIQMDESPPCDISIAPDSIKAKLPENIKEKCRTGQKMFQYEYMTLVKEMGEAAILKAWLNKDPKAAGNAYVGMKFLSKKAFLDSFIEARTNDLWGKRESRSQINKKSGKAKHAQIATKKEELAKIWASGKYTSRDICAEQECAALGISFSTARKALRNTPDPQRNS